VNKFDSCVYERGELGAPILPEAKAFFECKLIREKTLDLGTHTLFLGDVISAGARDVGDPLTYNEYRKQMKKVLQKNGGQGG